MRIKLTLKQVKPKQLIPADYHYAVTSFIYRTIEKSDSKYSEWLHSKGFADGSKRFKFFNFSDFYIPERNFNLPGKLEIVSDTFTFYISMLSDKTTEHLIIGMFESGTMRIFNEATEAEFYVKFIETAPEPDYKEEMRYKLLTPAVLSKKILLNGKEKIYFLDPADNDYEEYFINNIMAKYKIYSVSDIDEFKDKLKFRILSDSRKSIRSVKAGGKYETKIRGYKYDFDLSAPAEIHRMIWMSGIGIKNSLGFGFVIS